MAAKVLLAVACALTVLSAGIVDAAKLTFGETAKSGEPTTFTVITGVTATANDRIEIHLPGFGGAYNAFGNTHSTTAATGNFLPTANGISVVDAAGAVITTAALSGAEWDPSREILKVTVIAGAGGNANTFKGVKIDSKFLKMAYSATGKASGLGPIPPVGGINSDWWKLAYVRQYLNAGALCSGSDITDVGLGKDTCKFADFLVTPAAASYVEEAFVKADVATLASASPRLPVNAGAPASGAAVTPTFTTLKAKGTNTGTGANNCITVTMVPNVNLVTTDANSVTTITLHGLTGAATASTDDLALYLDGACGTVPAAAASTGVRVNAATSADTSSAANILATVDLLMSPASTKKTWQAAWNKEDGTIKFEVGQGRSISAGQTVVFSVQLVNGETVQESRAITASASGFMCKSNLCMPADDTAVEIPSTAFHSSSKILHVKPPTFETAKVSQSTTDPEQDATLTIQLKPNKDLKTDSSVLTITGLCGTLTNEDVTIAAGTGVTIGAAGQMTTPGAWDAATKTLKITMGTAGFTAQTTYTFSLTFKLLTVKNDACSIKVSATGTNTFVDAAMTNIDGKVGKVDEPMFKTLKIGQYTTRPNTDNYVCVTLKTNYLFNSDSTAEGANGKSTFTLSGLLGSQKENEQNTELYPCPTASDPTPTAYTAGTVNTAVPFKPLTAGRSAATYDFVKDGGKAVFVMDTTGFVRGTTYTFAMRIKNSKTASGCQTVTLATSGDIAQTATLAPGVATDKAIQDGEMDGDVCPLKTYAPGFLVRKVAQDSKLATDSNTLTVTLRSNTDFMSTEAGLYSTITISGLTGTTTPDTTTLADLSGDSFIVADKFVPNFKSVDWKQATGTLKLTLEAGACNAPTTLAVASTAASRSTCIKAGYTYVFSFGLKNGPSAQAAPPVAVKVLYGTDSEKNTDQQMMTGPADTALHALNILPETQILDTYKIGQLEAAQGGLNALCVTLTANKALTSEASATGGNRFVAFTIRGLTGFATDSQTLNVVDTDGTTATPANADKFFAKDESAGAANNELKYDSDKGEVSFFLKSGKTMAKDTDYSFCFQLTNPKMEMPCRDVTISAKDKDMATSEAITFKMTQDSGMLANYAKGSRCAGYTAPRAFTTATLRLNSAVVGYEATAIVELVTNYKIDTQKVITISGLSGFKALSQGAATESSDVDFVTFTENGLHAIDLGKKGTWD